jgi:hypothetical protein
VRDNPPSPMTHVDCSRALGRICTEKLRTNLITEKWLGVQLMGGEVVNAEKNEDIVEVCGVLGYSSWRCKSKIEPLNNLESRC